MHDLADIKRRLFVAAEAVYQIATSESALEYKPGEYAEIMEAFATMPTDIRRVMAQLDMYSAMFQDDLRAFLKEEDANGDGLRPDAGGSTPDEPDQATADGGAALPTDDKKSEGVPAAKRPARKRVRRSKSGGNKGESKEDS